MSTFCKIFIILRRFHIKERNMKKKFLKVLQAKCKDFGLTDKALDELSELGSQGLNDDASDEDIEKAADLLVPFAKAMQGEITRKTRKQPSGSDEPGKGANGDEGNDSKAALAAMIAEQLSPLKTQLDALKKENDTLKAEKSRSERQALIAEKAKKLGIPDYLMKRVSFADDADLDKELAEYKQELVNNNLMGKGNAFEAGGNAEESMKADADAWAKSLPDNK